MRKNAFTLAELLIVIAIIGIFTAVLFGSIGSARAKARDNRRITDVKQIQLALAVYFDVNRQYPAGNDASALQVLVNQKYMPELPTDPRTGAQYEYTSSALNRKYCMGTLLEGTVPSDNVTCTSGASSATANYRVQK
jgi:prepilin-type N-terminal cleavage/methylation domain-containing protein